MRFYADRPAKLTSQAIGDATVLVLTYLAVRLGMGAHDRIGALATPGREAESAARTTDRALRDAAGRVDDAPFVGGAVAKPFEVLAGTSRDLARTAQDYQDAVERLALLGGIVAAALPILLLLGLWLPRRVAWVVEASAAGRLMRAGPASADLLAVRALARQPLQRLAALGPEVVAGWKDDDPAAIERLARLELDELGLKLPKGQRPGTSWARS